MIIWEFNCSKQSAQSLKYINLHNKPSTYATLAIVYEQIVPWFTLVGKHLSGIWVKVCAGTATNGKKVQDKTG